MSFIWNDYKDLVVKEFRELFERIHDCLLLPFNLLKYLIDKNLISACLLELYSFDPFLADHFLGLLLKILQPLKIRLLIAAVHPTEHHFERVVVLDLEGVTRSHQVFQLVVFVAHFENIRFNHDV